MFSCYSPFAARIYSPDGYITFHPCSISFSSCIHFGFIPKKKEYKSLFYVVLVPPIAVSVLQESPTAKSTIQISILNSIRNKRKTFFIVFVFTVIALPSLPLPPECHHSGHCVLLLC